MKYYGRDRVYGIGCHKVDWKAIRAKKAEVQHAAVALIYAWDSGEPVDSWPLGDLRDALVESGADLHAALPFCVGVAVGVAVGVSVGVGSGVAVGVGSGVCVGVGSGVGVGGGVSVGVGVTRSVASK